jgi:hypothetical protein
MNAMLKMVLMAALIAWISDMAVKQFTSATDSDTERLIWRLGSAAAAGVALSKVF